MMLVDNTSLFHVFSKQTLVGFCKLEHGDTPMGVAFGQFIPNNEYSIIQNECTQNRNDQTHLQLSVKTQNGQTISCLGVSILDYSKETDEELIEVNMFGIPHIVYKEIFPQHIKNYTQQHQ